MNTAAVIELMPRVLENKLLLALALLVVLVLIGYAMSARDIAEPPPGPLGDDDGSNGHSTDPPDDPPPGDVA